MTDTTKTAENVIPRRRASDWKKPDEPAMNVDQLGIVLNDIATLARRINHFTGMMMVELNSGQDDEEAFLTAIESMAKRIGWAADMAADRINGAGGAVIGGAEKWMMPPLFHWKEAAAEGVKA